MRVLFCKGSLFGPISGPDEAVINYAVELRARGHQVAVLVMHPPRQNDPYIQRFGENGIEVLCASSGTSYWVLRAFRGTVMKLRRVLPPALVRRWESPASLLRESARGLLSRYGASLLHVLEPNGGTAAAVRAAHGLGIPSLYQESLTPFTLPENERWFQELEEVLPMIAELTALSPAVAGLWRIRDRDLRWSVLPLVARDPGVRPDQRIGHPMTFGFASRFDYWKGPSVLIEAFSLVHAKLPDARLRMAGSGLEAKAVRARAEALNIDTHCDFLGAYSGVEAKVQFMRSIDAFVQPSSADGTPNSVVEAMSHSLPIVASRVGGIPDLVSPQNGILVEPGDVHGLASAMIHLAQNTALREAMGAESRRRYEILFSPEAVLPYLLAVYGRMTRAGVAFNTNIHPWAEARGAEI